VPIAVIPAHDSRVANKYRTPAATMALTTFNLSPLGRRRNVLVEVEQVRWIVLLLQRCKLGILVRTVGGPDALLPLLAEEVHINSGFASTLIRAIHKELKVRNGSDSAVAIASAARQLTR